MLGTFDGMPLGTVDGNTLGLSDGVTDGAIDGSIDGAVDGSDVPITNMFCKVKVRTTKKDNFIIILFNRRSYVLLRLFYVDLFDELIPIITYELRVSNKLILPFFENFKNFNFLIKIFHMSPRGRYQCVARILPSVTFVAPLLNTRVNASSTTVGIDFQLFSKTRGIFK